MEGVPAADARAVVVITTVDEDDKARRIAHGLVEARLAACVSILGGMTSIYRWKGRISEGAEVLLLIKTSTTRLEELEAYLAEHHPYELPELLAVEAGAASTGYLSWLLQETAGPESRSR